MLSHEGGGRDGLKDVCLAKGNSKHALSHLEELEVNAHSKVAEDSRGNGLFGILLRNFMSVCFSFFLLLESLGSSETQKFQFK